MSNNHGIPVSDGGGSEPVHWKCKAQPYAVVPSDCDWPFCGCDSRADKVVETLIECGWKSDREHAQSLASERAAGFAEGVEKAARYLETQGRELDEYAAKDLALTDGFRDRFREEAADCRRNAAAIRALQEEG